MADEAPQPTPSEQGGNATGTPPETPSAPTHDERRFTQAELDAIVRDRLSEEKRRQEARDRRASEDAEAKRLADQQEFKALADRHEARIRELEPQAEQATRYEQALKKHLDAARKDLPAHITELLDQLDVAAQLDWISTHQADLTPPPAPGTAGVPATPRAAGTPSQADREEAAYQKMRRAGAYGRF